MASSASSLAHETIRDALGMGGSKSRPFESMFGAKGKTKVPELEKLMERMAASGDKEVQAAVARARQSSRDSADLAEKLDKVTEALKASQAIEEKRAHKETLLENKRSKAVVNELRHLRKSQNTSIIDDVILANVMSRVVSKIPGLSFLSPDNIGTSIKDIKDSLAEARSILKGIVDAEKASATKVYRDSVERSTTARANRAATGAPVSNSTVRSQPSYRMAPNASVPLTRTVGQRVPTSVAQSVPRVRQVYRDPVTGKYARPVTAPSGGMDLSGGLSFGAGAAIGATAGSAIMGLGGKALAAGRAVMASPLLRFAGKATGIGAGLAAAGNGIYSAFDSDNVLGRKTGTRGQIAAGIGGTISGIPFLGYGLDKTIESATGGKDSNLSQFMDRMLSSSPKKLEEARKEYKRQSDRATPANQGNMPIANAQKLMGQAMAMGAAAMRGTTADEYTGGSSIGMGSDSGSRGSSSGSSTSTAPTVDGSTLGNLDVTGKAGPGLNMDPSTFQKSGLDITDTSNSANVRHNNPGAQWPGKRTHLYQEGVDVKYSVLKDGKGNQIANFPSAVHGAAANMDLLKNSGNYVGKTLSEVAHTWGGGGNTEAYKAMYRKHGFDPDKKFTEEDTQNPELMKRLVGAKAEHEARSKDKGWLKPETLDKAYQMYAEKNGLPTPNGMTLSKNATSGDLQRAKDYLSSQMEGATPQQRIAIEQKQADITRLQADIKTKEAQSTTSPGNFTYPPDGSVNLDPMKNAEKHLGKHERTNRGDLKDYMTANDKSGAPNIDPAATPWCAKFVNSALGEAGIEGTGSNMARSFQKFGQERKGDPKIGDIVVMSRGAGPSGHVGFYAGRGKDGKIKVLGGNQGDSVNVTEYDASRVLSYRQVPQNAQAAVKAKVEESTKQAETQGGSAPMTPSDDDPSNGYPSSPPSGSPPSSPITPPPQSSAPSSPLSPPITPRILNPSPAISVPMSATPPIVTPTPAMETPVDDVVRPPESGPSPEAMAPPSSSPRPYGETGQSSSGYIDISTQDEYGVAMVNHSTGMV